MEPPMQVAPPVREQYSDSNRTTVFLSSLWLPDSVLFYSAPADLRTAGMKTEKQLPRPAAERILS